MNPIILRELRNSWFKKENIELKQKRRRRYLHFDEILESVSPSTSNKITNPDFIARYGFFPLIRRVQKNRLYKKDPVTKKRIIKTKPRPISYPAHFDALIYSWYGEQLSFFYENQVKENLLNDNVIAYRGLGKSNLSFAKEVFDFIKSQEKVVAIAFDIKGFYDSLDFEILKKSWAHVLSQRELPIDHYKVYRSVTKFSYVDIDDIKKVLNLGKNDSGKMKFFLNIDILDTLRRGKKIQVNKVQGIPQGTPISCVLSNIYMFDFDKIIANEVKRIGGMYRRYSDDIIVVCPQDKAEYIRGYLNDEIGKVRLIIEDSKTEIRFFEKKDSKIFCIDEEGRSSDLQYLGVKYNGLVTTLRHKGYAKFERRMVRSTVAEVFQAHSKKMSLAKRKLYEKFTSLGKANYVTYAKRAAKELDSKLIGESVSDNKLFKKLRQRITKARAKLNSK